MHKISSNFCWLQCLSMNFMYKKGNNLIMLIKWVYNYNNNLIKKLLFPNFLNFKKFLNNPN